MQVQVNSDKSITHDASLDEHVTNVVQTAVARFGEQISRVEVHLSDVNAHKSGAGDKRAMMEARVAGIQPIAVTDHADTLHQAISGASGKLVRALDTALGKRSDVKHNTPVADLVAPDEPVEPV
ncbi:sigma 54 modulation/S30EA-like ribosomal protein [Pseudoduganella lurida]|uniref:Sigma 54 modulation/S30EA-like ribosomal protein n=1 Tax=Pseudoduganella lurida TaxID=1036180 RepID=A0A562RAC7_9BURK|nr:HPF/RaiA family ribosome-associated protein [Pseudoduganella lurida]TWI65360.1 sigma 54 modulation/S30EA-like ribosomal protein [Pseudoduganella lurida]